MTPPAVLARRLAFPILLAAGLLAAAGTLSVDAGRTSIPAAARVPGVRYGIDVSHWQGRIAWHKVANSGIRFAIAKATDGLRTVDGTYHRNSRMARRAGLAFTAYHFARPSGGVANARAQADFFVKHAKLQPGDLVPALDLEKSGGLGPVALQRWVMAFLVRVEQRLGVKPMVYTSPGFWTGPMANTRAIARAGFQVLWIAHWETARPSVPARRWNGQGWTIWQWTKCGRVAGINGCVDRDALGGARLDELTIGSQSPLLHSHGMADGSRF
jgi:lysozyme